MKLVVTQVQGSVNGPEGLEVERDFLLFTIVVDDGSRVEDETVGGDFVVKLQPLLSGGDGGEDGLAVDAGLDVGGGSVLVAEHLGDAGDLVARRHDEGDHARAVASCGLEAFDQFLDFPDLDVGVCLLICHFSLDRKTNLTTQKK